MPQTCCSDSCASEYVLVPGAVLGRRRGEALGDGVDRVTPATPDLLHGPTEPPEPPNLPWLPWIGGGCGEGPEPPLHHPLLGGVAGGGAVPTGLAGVGAGDPALPPTVEGVHLHVDVLAWGALGGTRWGARAKVGVGGRVLGS